MSFEDLILIVKTPFILTGWIISEMIPRYCEKHGYYSGICWKCDEEFNK
jgi:hypothetical protein